VSTKGFLLKIYKEVEIFWSHYARRGQISGRIHYSKNSD